MADKKRKSPSKTPAADKTSKTTEPTASTQADNQDKRRNQKVWHLGRVFWGLLFVVVGSLLLLAALDVITVRIADLWRLWPLLIVGLGLSVMKLRGALAAIAGGAFIILALSGVVLVSLGNIRYETSNDVQSVVTERITEADSARITVKTGAGSLDIRSHMGNPLVSAALTNSFATLERTSEEQGDVQVVDIRLDNPSQWWRGSLQNDLNVSLSQTVPMELHIETGASDVQANLENVELQKLEIDAGASRLALKLGAETEMLEVQLDVGASSIELQVPQSSGVRVTLDSGLTGKDFDGLNEVSDGVYETPNYDSAENKITVRGNVGLSNIDINRY